MGRFAIILTLVACGTGSSTASDSGADAPRDAPGQCPVAEPTQGSPCSATTSCQYGGECFADACQCVSGSWECLPSPGASCDAATCPPPSTVIAHTPCPNPVLVCDGTILDSCGASLGDTFQCTCSGLGTWQCEGPDASGALCDGGTD